MIASIEAGMQFQLNNRVYEILSVGEIEIVVLYLMGDCEEHISLDDFHKYWLDRKIKLVHNNLKKSTREKLKNPISTLTKEQKKEVKKKENYILLYEEILEKKKSQKEEINYSKILQEIALELNDEHPPSHRTLLRWRSLYIKTNKSIRSLTSGYSNSGRKSSLSRKQKDLIRQAIDSTYLTPERGTVAETLNELEIIVEIYNREHPDQTIQCPSRFQLNSEINKLDFKTVLEKRVGKKEASRVTRTAKHNIKPSRILQVGETDHTILDYFVLDDELMMPLGRPWMTNILELFCRIPLGSDITYEHGSFMTISNALKMSILPKQEFYKHYPDINNKTNYSGKLELLRTDNGKEFISSDLDDIALELQMVLHHLKVTRSWQKGAIEGFFRKQNVKLIELIRGKAFRNILERAKYNPAKESLITLSEFKRILYKWLYDVYPFTKVRIEHGKEIIPHKLWEKNIINHAQDFIEKDFLDVICGKCAYRIAKEGGIEINNLKYDNEALAIFRSIHGNNENVNIKFDPSNLGFIHFYEPHLKTYIKVEAVDLEYADNLSLFQHNMIKNYVKEDMRQNDTDIKRLMDGKIQLREMIHDLYHKNPKKLATVKGVKARKGLIKNASTLYKDKEPNLKDLNSKSKPKTPNKESPHDDETWGDNNIEWE